MSAGLALTALALLQSGAQERKLVVVQELELPPGTADLWIGDRDGDGRADLLVVGTDGELSIWSGTPSEKEGAAPLEAGPSLRLELADPARSLLDPADLDPAASGLELAVLGPDGATLHRIGAPLAVESGAGAEGARPRREVLAARARLALRPGAPRFARFARDWNGDGRADLYVPGAASGELWLARPAPETGFARALRVPMSAWLVRTTPDDDLAGERSERVVIPRLDARDQNGDGRADLEVSESGLRRWYLQRADGSLPAEPDAVLDLGDFRDTTPPAEMAPGRILVAGERAMLARRDLSGDGIDDALVAHGRKVWVFPGGHEGPQFREPSQILRSAEDLSAVTSVELDADGKPDLLVVKVEIPSLTSLLLGMISEWRIHVRCAGYQNRDGRSFETTPRWRSELVLTLPPLMEILRAPEKLLERFEEIGDALRVAREADLDGDGALDLLLLDPRANELGAWLGRRAGEDGRDAGDAVLREAIFEADPDWTLERVLAFLRALAERRSERLTGGAPADASLELGPHGDELELQLERADFDGDGRAEIAVVERLARGTRAPRRVRIVGLR